MGYAGGSQPEPTYRSLGDHTECFQVDFDPAVLGYEALLDLVWDSHDPTYRAPKEQYASLVLAHDDGQLAIARASARRLGDAIGRPVATRIEPLSTFWLAEDYHQKYYLRHDRVLMADFRGFFGDDEDALRESTAAMRANSIVAGHSAAPHDIARMGLSDAGRRRVEALTGRAQDGVGCPAR